MTFISTKFVLDNNLKIHNTNELISSNTSSATNNNKLKFVKVKFINQNTPYETSAVLFDLPNNYDVILGMSFFEHSNPAVNWKEKLITISLTSSLEQNVTDKTTKCQAGVESFIEEARPPTRVTRGLIMATSKE